MENYYLLYENSDPDELAKANSDINDAIYHAAVKASGGDVERAWQEIVKPVLHQYEHLGATDTVSRELVRESFLYAKREEDDDAYPERRHPPAKKKAKPEKYYVVYPDPTSDKRPAPFPSDLAWEAFDNVDDARQRARELDKGNPPRDLVVIKGILTGFISGDAYDAEFLDGPKEKT